MVRAELKSVSLCQILSLGKSQWELLAPVLVRMSVGRKLEPKLLGANAAVWSLLSVSSARLPCARLELGLEQHQQTCEMEQAGCQSL